MSQRRIFLAGASASVGLAAFSANAAPPPPIGVWGGVLQANMPLRLRLELSAEQSGALSATLRSLDQPGGTIPASAANWDGDQLTVRFAAITATYQAQLQGDALVGEWRQGGTLPLTLYSNPDFDALLEQIRPEPLDAERLEALRAAAGAPAMIAMARRSSRPSLGLFTGMRMAGGETSAALEDPWHLGSITKSFTAMLVARMVEAGMLAWETPLAEALPDLAESMRPEYQHANLLHLLSHRSGLPANLPTWRLLLYKIEEPDARESRLAYAREALSQKPVGPLGERFEYSNSGYVLAGLLCERAWGAPWEALLDRHVLQPLGLASAGHGAPTGAVPFGHAASLLSSAPQPYPPGKGRTDNPAVLGPAGRLHMRLDDLLKYLEQHRDRGGFLSANSWRRLHTPPFGGDYALGWTVQGDGKLWHNGSNTLWYAEARVDRSAGTVAAVAANDGRLGAVAPQVARALWAAEIAVGGG